MSLAIRICLVIILLYLFIKLYCMVLFWKSFQFPNDEKHFNATLKQLLIPRWPGSLGQGQVSEFLLENLRELGFHTVRDEFFDGVRFTNIVGVFNTKATSFLMLCCHYDSKILMSFENYVGATDGAVSCAILLNIVKNLNSFLTGEFSKRSDIGLVLVFFDGHESFEPVEEQFNSLYGARHFADVELIPLQSIELVVALNLIGAPNHIYMSHYENTFHLHTRLADIELELLASGQLSPCHQLFRHLKDHDSDIEDDHYPLLMEGVPALHIVPHTFPDVWHTEADNLENLHFPSIRNMNLILTHFVYEYLKNHVDAIDARTKMKSKT